MTITHVRLKVAMTAALNAGEHMVERFGTQLEIFEKTSAMDVVTDVDLTCNRIIEETILRTFPEDKILSEESPSLLQDNKHSPLWIIDPLDGTTNYTRNIAFSSVSIGYMENGEVTIGVIYDPHHKEFFFSIKGQGARYAGSSVIIAWLKEDIDNMPGEMLVPAMKDFDSRTTLVALGIPSNPQKNALALSKTLKLIPSIKGIRDFGSSALHLAYVAAGRLDAYVAFGQFIWDYSAGILVVREAGGFVTFMSSDDDTQSQDMLAYRTQACGSELITNIR